MTVSTSTSTANYTANGSTTTFAYPFKIFADSDLVVILRNTATGVETVQVLNSAYTVTGAGNVAGGNVVFGTAPASGNTVFIRRELPLTQETDFVPNDPFPAEAHENALDKLTMLVQQTSVDADRAIVFPASDSGLGLNNVLPSVTERRAKLIQFTNDGSVDVIAPADLGTAIIGANYVVDTFTGSGGTTIYALSAAPGSTNNTAVYIDGVYQSKSNYSVSGSTLTFSTAPPLNSAIEIVVGDAIPAGAATTAAGVSYTQGGSGAVSRTVQSRLRDFVSVKDFGAVGDGVTDDTAAIQAALDSGASSIYVPVGTYILTSKLTYTTTLTTKSFSLVGEDQVKTIFKWSSASGGMEFTLPAAASQITSKVSLKNMSLVTTYAGGGAAIKVNRTASAVVAPNNLFEDLYIYQEGSGYWNYGIHSIDASDAWFNRLYIMMFGASSTACVFIDNNLTSQSVYGAYFSQCSFNGAVNSLKTRGQLESVYITDCSLVGSTDVIDVDATGTTFGNPHLTVQSSHLNAKRTTIKCDEWRAIFISDTDVYSGVGTGDVAGNNVQISDADHVSIVGCKFEIGAPANARSFINFANVNNFVVSGNNMNNASAAGIVISGASGKGVITSNTMLGFNDGTKNNEAIYNVATTGYFTYTGNVIDFFSTGILFNSNNNTVVGNTLLNLDTGINSVGGLDNYAKGNTFSSVTALYSGSLHREFFATATVNPASIPAGDRHTELVTISGGAVVGDFVDFAAPYDVSDLIVTANIQNTNTVGLYFYNGTGGAVDLASGTWKFRVHS